MGASRSASGWALHLRTGERLERGHGERAGEIAGELAMHFEHGRDFERAARYREQAGENALRQHGYREAADHATRALESLRALPDSQERAQQELALQVVLGAALTATQGYAAPEVARRTRAPASCATQVGRNPAALSGPAGARMVLSHSGHSQDAARDVG